MEDELPGRKHRRRARRRRGADASLWTGRGTHPRDCASIAGADVIIGTDLLYHLTTQMPFATATRLMRAGGVFLLGGHSRYYGTVQSVCMRAHGLVVNGNLRSLQKAEALSTAQRLSTSWAQRRRW